MGGGGVNVHSVPQPALLHLVPVGSAVCSGDDHQLLPQGTGLSSRSRKAQPEVAAVAWTHKAFGEYDSGPNTTDPSVWGPVHLSSHPPPWTGPHSLHTKLTNCLSHNLQEDIYTFLQISVQSAREDAGK